MWLADSDPAWRQYLQEQRARWFGKPFKRPLKLTEMFSSAIQVNKELAKKVKDPENPECWWFQLRNRRPEEYDEPITVAWDYEPESTAAAMEEVEEGQVVEPTPDAPIAAPSEDVEMATAEPEASTATIAVPHDEFNYETAPSPTQPAASSTFPEEEEVDYG